jgi:hypothetical protein
LHARVTLASRADGLHVTASSRDPDPPRIPAAAPGSRVADLWHYDVVELFLVGRGGRYLELELGPAGHFLLLSFRAPRERADDHAGLRPAIAHARGPSGWSTSLTLDWSLVPEGVTALNAFACPRGRDLAHHPVPGVAPDFHQPAAFPPARIDR